MRERMFTMRLSDDESARLDRLAAHYGLNGAGVIRMLVKREDDAILAAAPRIASPLHHWSELNKRRARELVSKRDGLAIRFDGESAIISDENGRVEEARETNEVALVVESWPTRSLRRPKPKAKKK